MYIGKYTPVPWMLWVNLEILLRQDELQKVFEVEIGYHEVTLPDITFSTREGKFPLRDIQVGAIFHEFLRWPSTPIPEFFFVGGT